MELISVEDVAKAANLKGPGSKGVAKVLMSAFKLNKLNELYEKHADTKGFDFVNMILQETGIKYKVPVTDLERVPKTGPFIIISNHPYGGAEGLILLDALKNIRPDIKIIANFLFQKIEPLNEFIFPVNPFETYRQVSSFQGLKEAMLHLSNEHPILIFPAGEVSTFYPGSTAVADRKWSKPALKFIKKVNVPVVPVFFKGTNSHLFHLLGMIHPTLRTGRLPAELLNKKDKPVNLRIGSAITVKEQAKFSSVSIYGRYLRARVYALDTSEDVKKFFFPKRSESSKHEVVSAVDPLVLQQEINALPAHYKVTGQNKLEVYCAPSSAIPNMITEIGRMREITFREVGEGTNMSIDLDEYDLYYHHLFIWHADDKKLVGAYRLGFGQDIIDKYGIKGFYTRSLFKFKKEIYPIFTHAIEVGRSFVIKEYQKSPLPLFLLWKGIFLTLVKRPDYQYLIGPVSISNDYSKVSKRILIDYITRNHFNNELAKYVKPRKKFKVRFPNVDTEILSDTATDLVNIDKVIADIEHDRFKMPVLLKKYIQLNGKIVAFNIDPKFNDALDGLLILNFHDTPREMIDYLSRESETKS
ncbi:MAG TPA: lysophospholipid acyltransferase family protein [Bacteroidales bacterium]|nr:lysophospholipid acyltransferase family protein [Bacteroidales bacterium]